jgi:hypothetical protein
MKSKGGLEGSMPRPVGGWVCYNLIAQKIDQYRKEIDELKENINPMNTPKV